MTSCTVFGGVRLAMEIPVGRLMGKVAIITGGTQGVGEGIARKFVKEGAKVVITSRSPDKGDRVVKELRSIAGCQGAVYVQHDITDKARAKGVVAEAIETFGRIDILANNAQTITPWKRLEDNDCDESLDIFLLSGVYATMWLCQAVFPHMKAQMSGRIINCASFAGDIGMRYLGLYGSNKEAIRGLTRSLANEWGRYNITANVFLPATRGPNYQNLVDSRNALSQSDPLLGEQRRKMELTMSYQPVQSVGDEAVGAALVGLASDSGRFITGQSFYIDAGLHLWAINHHHNMPGSFYQSPSSYDYLRRR